MILCPLMTKRMVAGSCMSHAWRFYIDLTSGGLTEGNMQIIIGKCVLS